MPPPPTPVVNLYRQVQFVTPSVGELNTWPTDRAMGDCVVQTRIPFLSSEGTHSAIIPHPSERTGARRRNWRRRRRRRRLRCALARLFARLARRQRVLTGSRPQRGAAATSIIGFAARWLRAFPAASSRSRPERGPGMGVLLQLRPHIFVVKTSPNQT